MNKTKVINALSNLSIDESKKKTEAYKEVITIRSTLRKRKREDIESISHLYAKILELYWLSAKEQISKDYRSYLKNAVKEIMKTNIKIDFYSLAEVKHWYRFDML